MEPEAPLEVLGDRPAPREPSRSGGSWMLQTKSRCGQTLALAIVVGGVVAGAPVAVAQESQDQAEARELVIRIRQSMREVNKLLLDGSTEGAGTEAARVARDIEKLLDEAENKSKSVVDGLEKLMEMAQQQQQQQQQSQSSQSNQDQQQQNQNQNQPQREKSDNPQELVDQQQGNKDQQQQKPDGEKPDGNKPDQSPPDKTKASEAPPPGATGSFEREDTSGRWGVLPAKQAEDLQRYEVQEFPLRYRHWMDLYFRRVNKSSSDG